MNTLALAQAVRQRAAGDRGQEARQAGHRWPGLHGDLTLRSANHNPNRRPLSCSVVRSPLSHPLRLAAPGRRAGLTLTEVLVATFVAVLGMVSLSALLPVGMMQVAMASRSDVAAGVGRAAWKTIKVADLIRPAKLNPDVNPPAQGMYWTLNDGATWGTWRDLQTMGGAFYIDPFGLSNSPAAGMGQFPVENGTVTWGARPARVTLAAQLGPRQNRSKIPDLLARKMFTGGDDPVFGPVVEGLDRPQRMYANNEPLDEGNYTWAITVSPAVQYTSTTGNYILRETGPASAAGVNASSRLFHVAVVVYHKRAVPPRNGRSTTREERLSNIIPAADFYSNGRNGGDVRLTWSGDQTEYVPVQPGNWIALTGRMANGPWVIRWYRIVAADDLTDLATTSGTAARFMTLAGPDWDLVSTGSTQAALVQGVVGVYEKTIRVDY